MDWKLQTHVVGKSKYKNTKYNLKNQRTPTKDVVYLYIKIAPLFD